MEEFSKNDNTFDRYVGDRCNNRKRDVTIPVNRESERRGANDLSILHNFRVSIGWLDVNNYTVIVMIPRNTRRIKVDQLKSTHDDNAVGA